MRVETLCKDGPPTRVCQSLDRGPSTFTCAGDFATNAVGPIAIQEVPGLCLPFEEPYGGLDP